MYPPGVCRVWYFLVKYLHAERVTGNLLDANKNKRKFNMFRTHQNIEKFSETIKEKKRIVCDKEGEQWKQQNMCHRINEMLKCKTPEHSRLITIGKVFNNLLDSLEKSPILFDAGEEITKKQITDLKPYLDLSETVIEELKHGETKEIRAELESIRMKVIGLKYRIGAIHGGLDAEKIVDEEMCQHLISLADRWKDKQKLYPKTDKLLKLRDIQKFVEACQYPLFAKMLLSNTSLQEMFFKWTIRDNNGVAQFIEFPGVCKRLRNSFLEKRLGRLFPEELAIKKTKVQENAWKKDICLPFYDGEKTNQISILDETTEVMLNGNWRLTIKEIFDIFAYKSIDPGNISIFGSHGIMNWHIYECGVWNPVRETYDRPNLDSKDWWKELPSFETLTKKEVAERYGVKLNPGEWLKCLKASRETLDYGIFGRHSYFEMIIPLENGMYGVYPFGFFPYHYPTGKLQQMHLITQTVPGRIAYIDENTCYSQRQKATYPKVISEEQGKLILEEIRSDILRSLQGELPFQLKGENCSFWAQKIFNSDENNKSNYFEMRILEMKPCHPVIDKMMDLPPPMANGVLKGLRFFANRDGMHLTATGEKIYKISQFATNIHEETQLQPGLLFEKIEEGTLKGGITFGN